MNRRDPKLSLYYRNWCKLHKWKYRVKRMVSKSIFSEDDQYGDLSDFTLNNRGIDSPEVLEMVSRGLSTDPKYGDISSFVISNYTHELFSTDKLSLLSLGLGSNKEFGDISKDYHNHDLEDLYQLSTHKNTSPVPNEVPRIFRWLWDSNKRKMITNT